MTTLSPAPNGFRHEALLYTADETFLKAMVPFIENGIEADEAVLVVVDERKINLLKSELSEKASSVSFANMDDVGLNPARIIPAWQRFVDENTRQGRHMRGIGEPIWPARSGPALAECHHHEALLNVAFTSAKHFWLMCPYNRETLPAEVIERMAFNHPFVSDGVQATDSAMYDFQLGLSQPFLEPLPEPPDDADGRSFSGSSLGELRVWVANRALVAGLVRSRADDLVLAVNEVATNSVRHGGGSGRILMWEDAGSLVCDIYDSGHIRQPLAGREIPPPAQDRGRGLWLVNHVCDLVQIRSSTEGTVVRLRQSLATPVSV